jgi:hypothetical protein
MAKLCVNDENALEKVIDKTMSKVTNSVHSEIFEKNSVQKRSS